MSADNTEIRENMDGKTVFYICFPCKNFRRASDKDFFTVLPSESSCICQRCNRPFKYRYQLSDKSVTPEQQLSGDDGVKAHSSANNSEQVNQTNESSHLSKFHLENSMQTPEKEKSFDCEICKKVFKQKRGLKRHHVIHSDKNPFECKECGRRFTCLSHLKDHLRIHSKEKPFACEECDKRFKRKRDLKDHFRIHSKEKPFECEECDRRFKRKGDLKCHLRIHTNEKPFRCEQCDKRFTVRWNLKRHMVIHSKEKPFRYEECSKQLDEV